MKFFLGLKLVSVQLGFKCEKCERVTKILCNLDSLSKIKSINNDDNIIKSCNIVLSSFFGRARICNFSPKSL